MDKPDEPKLTLATDNGHPVGCTKAELLEMERQEALARRRVSSRAAKRPPPHNKLNVTPRQRRMVMVALAAGLNQIEVAGVMGISVSTLQKRFRKELDDGAATANAKVASRLFNKCMKGDTIALIFWAKARLGWNDRQRVEVTGKGGGPIQHETVQAEADAFTQRIASMADRFAKMMVSDADEEDAANDGGLTQKSTEAVGE